MLFVAIASALAAVVFLVLWLSGRSSLSTTARALETEKQERAAAEARADDLRTRLEDAERDRSEQAARINEMTEAAAEQAEQLADLETAVQTSEAEVGRLRADLDASASAAAELDAELASTADELASRAAEITELTHRGESLQEELAAAQHAASKRGEAVVPPVLIANSDGGNHVAVPGFSPETAWLLELVRSERTWRYSVSTNPLEDPSPFESTDSPLRLAIEVEALALREDVGAFINIDWQVGDLIDPALDPARAHLTLRLAQEMLAAAAREVEPSELIVSADPEGSGLSMRIVPADGDTDFNIAPPPIASEWIDIDHDGGMVVTVRTGQSKPSL